MTTTKAPATVSFRRNHDAIATAQVTVKVGRDGEPTRAAELAAVRAVLAAGSFPEVEQGDRIAIQTGAFSTYFTPSQVAAR